MKIPMNAISSVIEVLLRTEAVKAVKYLTPTLVVRAVRKRYDHLGKGFARRKIEVSLTVGVPNYVEKEAIALCVKAGEPFPVKKIRLKLKTHKKVKLSPKK